MEATRILAIRHGETAWNVDTRIQGQLDIDLNERGRWQARRVAQALAHEPVQAIFSSDLRRAFETASAIAQALPDTLAVVAHADLRERHFGHFQGQTWTEIEAQWPEDARQWRGRDPDWSPSGGESLATLRARVARCVEAMARQHLGGQIVLVAHGGVMDVLYRLATGQDARSPRTWQLGNAAINRLLWTPQGLTLVGWGHVEHLQDMTEAPRDEGSV